MQRSRIVKKKWVNAVQGRNIFLKLHSILDCFFRSIKNEKNMNLIKETQSHLDTIKVWENQ